MSASSARLKAVESVKNYTPPTQIFPPPEAPGKIFGQNVFSKSVIQARLPKAVFKSVISTIEHSKPLDLAVADAVASAMKAWAMERGATHYVHVFYPLTGLTAEKHDSFLEPEGDVSSIAEFAGKTLVQGEPGASSFLAGGRSGVLPDRPQLLPVADRPVQLRPHAVRCQGPPRAPKGQEFDDHYFGAIPERVIAYMLDAERELFKLGIPAKTRHDEVAPGQFELAPMFEKANIAADHQQLLMVILERVAQKQGLECLLYEKPFVGINDSAKHVNFSVGNSTEGNLLLPGATPPDNAQFLVFCGAVIRSVYEYGGLLRASVASATNDHRLGANGAPPAIISIFLGDQLSDIFDQIAKGGVTNSKDRGFMNIGVDTLPVLPTDPGDRNRTSPFAFTGNRFEFRAPGSLQSIAGPMVTINTILAEALELFSHYGVFNHREMHSRYEIALEQYAPSIDVGARLTSEIATTVILPAAIRYQTELATNAASLEALVADDLWPVAAYQEMLFIL